ATRILKLEDPAQTGGAREESEVELDPERELERQIDPTAFGVAVHRVLEALPARGWRPPTDREIESALREEGVDSTDARDEARAMVDGFLASELAAEAKGHRADVETGLLVDLDGVIVRGFADLLVRRPERPLILDYKSNRLEGTSVEELMAE